MVLAALSFFKANRERGIALPEMQSFMKGFGCKKRQSEKILKLCTSMGYVVHSGHFPLRNRPKRYVPRDRGIGV